MPLFVLGVVSYRNSTSNHNCTFAILHNFTLYLIEILHQTTTGEVREIITPELYLIEILHQTTTGMACSGINSSCILSKFYIKPQPEGSLPTWVVGCILSKFYIKPQPGQPAHHRRHGCILSKFYIKPQRCRRKQKGGIVVSYRNSTSNHNAQQHTSVVGRLYLIEILHQTTT